MSSSPGSQTLFELPGRSLYLGDRSEEPLPEARPEDQERNPQAAQHGEDHRAGRGVFRNPGEGMIVGTDEIDCRLHGGVHSFQRKYTRNGQPENGPFDARNLQPPSRQRDDGDGKQFNASVWLGAKRMGCTGQGGLEAEPTPG